MKTCKIDICNSTDLATRSALCKEHHREYTRAHYQANKSYYAEKRKRNQDKRIAGNRKFLIGYLRTHNCVDCGNNDIEVLQFDHVDRTTKSAAVSDLISSSPAKLWAEVQKCEVRCANCHTKRTRRQMGHWTEETAPLFFDFSDFFDGLGPSSQLHV